MFSPLFFSYRNSTWPAACVHVDITRKLPAVPLDGCNLATFSFTPTLTINLYLFFTSLSLPNIVKDESFHSSLSVIRLYPFILCKPQRLMAEI